MREDGPVLRSELPMSFRRLIKTKEQYLGRRCGKIWIATNPLNQRFVYGRFNKGRKDCIIVTIGSRHFGVGWIPSN
jgi:hypothetical protein